MTRSQEKQITRAKSGLVPITRSRAALLSMFTVDEVEAAEALIALRQASGFSAEPSAQSQRQQQRPRRSVARYA